MTSATERLRALLDERGVEWKAWDGVHPVTVWHDKHFSYEYMERTLLDGVKPYTGEVVDGTGRLEAVIHVCTPAQAIDATLGRGTCENTEQLPLAWSFTCSECGVHSITEGERFSYCPNCGRRVVE